MRLGFHYHVPALSGGSRIWMPGFQGRFVEALADYASEVVCFLHTPVGSERQQMDYTVRRPNVRLVSVGPHFSVPRRILSARYYNKIIRNQAKNLDALLLRGPSPLLPSIAGAIRPLPTSLLLVGDALAGIKDLPQPFWRKLAIRMLWQWNRHGQDRVARTALTFVNSRKLLEELQAYVPNLVETRTTTLTAADFFLRDNTCFSRPFRLLYVGRLDRGKGLLDIIDALSILRDKGEDLVFDMVGWPETGDPILQEIELLAREKGVSDRVKYHGRKALGPELFTCYERADIFVLASKSSEGFPRTIWEAMAHSLPVVATRVGSIPHFISAAAALAEPNDAPGLANVIRTLIHSPEQRARMIVQGRKLASEVTLEKQVKPMVERMRAWLKQVS